MDKPLVSVVVPFYNAEKHLAGVLESLQNQTYPNLEILLVDDGSTDGSAGICQDYVREDARFWYVRKLNGGVSSARNVGLDCVNGDFVQFMDSDDWIEPVQIENCVTALLKNQADMLVFGMEFDIERKGKTLKKIFKTIPSRLMRKEDVEACYQELFDNNYLSSMCNRIFRRDMVVRAGIRFNEKLTNYEDFVFSIRCLNECKVVCIREECYYHYMMRGELGMSIRYKPNLNPTLPVLVKDIRDAHTRLHLSEATRQKLEIFMQRMLWMGVLNLCRSTDTWKEKSRKIAELCSQTWVKEELHMMKNHDCYNDVNVKLYKQKAWLCMTLFNDAVIHIRDIKY